MKKERELVSVCCFCETQCKTEDDHCGTCGHRLLCSFEKNNRVCESNKHDWSSGRGIFCARCGSRRVMDASPCPNPDELVVYSEIAHDLSFTLSEEQIKTITEHVLDCEGCLAFLRELESVEPDDPAFHQDKTTTPFFDERQCKN